jgi:hypothetical protein
MVDYGKFNLLNILAIQSLIKENEDLKIRVEKLEKLVNDLLLSKI